MGKNSLTFDGVYLGDVDIGAILQTLNVPTLAGVPLVDFRQVAHGKPHVEGSDSYEGGELVVPLLLPGVDYTDSEGRRSALLKLLSRPGKRFIFFDNLEQSTKYKGKLIAAPAAQYIGSGLAIELTFGIDPFRYLRTDYSQVIAITPPTTTDVPLTSVVPGNATGHPLWLLQNTSGGLFTGTIILTNSTTNEQVRWTGSISDDDYIQFDSTERLVVETGSDPSALNNAMSGVTPGGVIPTIECGVQNSVTVAGFTGELTITLTPEIF